MFLHEVKKEANLLAQNFILKSNKLKAKRDKTEAKLNNINEAIRKLENDYVSLMMHIVERAENDPQPTDNINSLQK
jgi:hypothetical protein